MTKTLFTSTALIMILLSACSGGAPTETGTPAATETQVAPTPAANTDTPVVTETSTADSATPSTAAATEGVAGPTNPPDCTNSAAFVADITIPDETNVAGGTAFTKTWRINNNGTCVWGPTYTLSHYSEERMAAPDSVPLAITYPGQNLDISVDLTAPSGTGKHQANFVIKNPAGLIMNVGDDSRLWVVINVTVTGAATVAATATLTPPAAGNTATSTSAVAAPTVPAGGSSSPTTCLFSIDRTKLTETIDAVNAYRAQNGLPIFVVNAKLARAAQKHANDMACNKLSAHTGSDQSTPQLRVTDAGYTASSVSENVQGSNPPLSGQDVVSWWIDDTTDVNDKDNLASRNFTEIGVGYSFFENYGYYVIVFAQP
jgi:uncharacterized protein YkwD